MRTPTARLFVAVWPDENLRGEIAGVVGELKKADADIKWVSAENLHLTLKFLGEVETGKVEEIVSTLKSVRQKSFEMEVGNLGAIPNSRHPKTIFADVTSGGKPLQELAQAIGNTLEKTGFERDPRAFIPHVTLGRVKSPKNLQKYFLKMSEHKGQIFGKISVTRFYLVKSDIRPQGPAYTEIAEIPLENGGENE